MLVSNKDLNFNLLIFAENEKKNQQGREAVYHLLDSDLLIFRTFATVTRTYLLLE